MRQSFLFIVQSKTLGMRLSSILGDLPQYGSTMIFLSTLFSNATFVKYVVRVKVVFDSAVIYVSNFLLCR
jgi:hypothetical protein